MSETKINKLENSEVELTGEISFEELAKFRPQVLKSLGENAEVDGFRKGHVPEKVLIEKIGEDKILLEMAELAIEKFYPATILENKIDAIGRPMISITKLAVGNPLCFTIKTAVMPEIKLPDYKKIAKAEASKKEEEIIVTDKDVDEVIEELRKMRGTKEGEEVILPLLDDEFAKSLGNFASLEELKAKVKENTTEERKARAKEKKRLTIMDQIIDQAEMKLPRVLIESELDKMLHEMKGQVAQMGLNFEDYLKHLKKTEEELVKSWEEQAAKRVKFGLILTQVAQTEKISASEEDINHETDHLLEHYKDVDRERAKEYVSEMLSNEKVLQFLEGQN